MNKSLSITAILLSLLMTFAFVACDGGGPDGGGPDDGDVTTFNVTYNANEADSGTVPVDSNDYEEGDTVVVSSNYGNLTKTGHYLANWCTNSDGSGDCYAPGDSFTKDNSEEILYANWQFAGPATEDLTDGNTAFANGIAGATEDNGSNYTDIYHTFVKLKNSDESVKIEYDFISNCSTIRVSTSLCR